MHQGLAPCMTNKHKHCGRNGDPKYRILGGDSVGYMYVPGYVCVAHSN